MSAFPLQSPRRIALGSPPPAAAMDCIWGPLCAAAIAVLALAGAAGAKSARDYLQPALTHQHFTTMVSALQLPREQRVIAEVMFGDYLASLDALANQADQRADQAGRGRLLEALAGRALIAPDELRRLRVAILEIYSDLGPAADEQIDDLLMNIEMVLTEEQREALPGLLPPLRRSLLLHPRQRERHSYEYAGDGVDLLQLMDAAGRRDGELAGLPEEALRDVRERYAAQLDEVLQQIAAPRREAALRARIARIQRDREGDRGPQSRSTAIGVPSERNASRPPGAGTPALREAEIAGIEHWRRLFEVNRTTSNRIAQIAADRAGPEAAERWRDRFDQAVFPWLFDDARPLPTPAQQADIERLGPDEQRIAQNAEQIIAEYRTRRRDLLREASDLMLTARLEMQVIVHPMTDAAELPGPLAMTTYQGLLHVTADLAAARKQADDALNRLLAR